MAAGTDIGEEHLVETEHRVTPLELFFDLVFVFALTQVTTLMARESSWADLGRGMLMLIALWWAWAAYAWLTNTIDPDEGRARIAMFVSMTAMLIAALAAPDAFADYGVLFACAYFVVRVMHIVVYAEATGDIAIHEAALRLARTAVPAPALLIVAALLDSPAREIVWIVALTIDLAGPYVFGIRGLTVHPAHFAERFGLVVIIALGESIVAIGVGAEGTSLSVGVVVAAVLGVVVSAALWWSYFDVVAVVAERRFRRMRGYAQVRLARDSYAYLHLPMIAGIVLLALGIKKTVGHYDEPLEAVPALGLLGGIALYYTGHVGFRLRNLGSLNRQRLLIAIVCLALMPLAVEIDALISLAIAAALTGGLVAYEAIRFAESRARIRGPEADAMTAP
ncbi:MAG TPA: low temperature requirement protein A [Thermoleophilaceae bacterium]|jgi:low temperature requirement protein LtrA